MAENVAQFFKKIAFALFYILIYFALLYLLMWQVKFLEEDVENYSEIITIFASVASLGIYLIILHLREIRVVKYVRFKRITLVDGVLAFMLAFGFRILTGAYLLWSRENVPLLQKSIEGAQYGYSFNTMTTLGIISVVVSVCIVAPFFEEILFRGMVLRELRSAMPDALAIVLQAILFGLAHAVLAQSLFAAVYGLILGMIYVRTRNISVVILSHMFFNISSVLEVKSADAINQMFISGLVMTLSAIILFFSIYKGKNSVKAGKAIGGNSDV